MENELDKWREPFLPRPTTDFFCILGCVRKSPRPPRNLRYFHISFPRAPFIHWAPYGSFKWSLKGWDVEIISEGWFMRKALWCELLPSRNTKSSQFLRYSGTHFYGPCIRYLNGFNGFAWSLISITKLYKLVTSCKAYFQCLSGAVTSVFVSNSNIGQNGPVVREVLQLPVG